MGVRDRWTVVARRAGDVDASRYTQFTVGGVSADAPLQTSLASRHLLFCGRVHVRPSPNRPWMSP